MPPFTQVNMSAYELHYIHNTMTQQFHQISSAYIKFVALAFKQHT